MRVAVGTCALAGRPEWMHLQPSRDQACHPLGEDPVARGCNRSQEIADDGLIPSEPESLESNFTIGVERIVCYRSLAVGYQGKPG
jgi:hypothetical protein